MSDANSQPAEAAAPTSAAPAYPILRIWPAVVLVVVAWAAQLVPLLSDEAGLVIVGFMIAMFTPMACGLLLGVWWFFFSRARWKERLVGAAGGLIVATAAFLLAHPTVRNFFPIIVPTFVTAFGLGMVLVHRWQSGARVPVALVLMALGVCYWDFVRFEGLTGDFNSQILPRWQVTAEEKYVAALGKQPAPAVPAAAGDAELGPVTWPGFRGPARDSVVPGLVLETDWKSQPPELLWTKPVGPGWSSFAIAGNRLFTQEQRGDNEATVCWDADTGDACWIVESPARFFEAIAGPGPRATPTLADGRLFVQGATGLLHCLEPATGSIVWKRDIQKDADRKDLPVWGFSSSPLVTHGVVIVHAGGTNDRGVLAYALADGELKWKVPAGANTYSSPQLARLDGRDYVLMLTDKGLHVIDPEAGTVAVDFAWPYEGHRVVQPLLADAGSVVLGTGMGTGTKRVAITAGGGAVSLKETWLSKQMNPDFNDFVAHKGYLYGFDQAIFACIDLKSGERKWKKGRYGKGQVLLLPDADQLLVLSEKGEAILLHASPRDLEELARFKVLEGKTWNHPALVGDRFYARNGEQAACVMLPVRPSARQPAGAGEGE